MSKVKSAFFCQNCGNQSPKWEGKCIACGQWNTYVEEIIKKDVSEGFKVARTLTKSSQTALKIEEVSFKEHQRIVTKDQELNRVLGGGIVHGSVILIGGEPGIGKSTLLLQLALSLSQKVLYVSGEESEQQIKMRADRINQKTSNCFVLNTNTLNDVFVEIERLSPELLIIDSIQTVQMLEIDSTPGSISQVRACAGELIKFAKESHIPVFLVGHITKEGSLAGPKVLEHMVDTVLQFEGDRHLSYRLLRTSKNRFGSTAELGIYEMIGSGLREVSNPSEILITQRNENASGVAIASTIEGNRPLLVEVQALVTPATYGTPQRSTTGIDIKRLNMLIAVLEKRCGLVLGNQDIFLNIAGGLKISDPAVDLAICMAIFSSFQDVALPEDACYAGEIGLGAEIRPVHKIDNRAAEAEKLGFTKIYVAENNRKSLSRDFKLIKVVLCKRITDIISDHFG